MTRSYTLNCWAPAASSSRPTSRPPGGGRSRSCPASRLPPTRPRHGGSTARSTPRSSAIAAHPSAGLRSPTSLPSTAPRRCAPALAPRRRCSPKSCSSRAISRSRPLPPYVADWADSGTFATVPNAAWQDINRAPDWSALAPDYIKSLQYDLTVLGDWLTSRLAGQALVILLGDHQPPAMVGGELERVDRAGPCAVARPRPRRAFCRRRLCRRDRSEPSAAESGNGNVSPELSRRLRPARIVAPTRLEIPSRSLPPLPFLRALAISCREKSIVDRRDVTALCAS